MTKTKLIVLQITGGLLCALAIYGFVRVARKVHLSLDSHEWKPVTAELIKKELESTSSPGRGGMLTTETIKYRYEWGGQEYTGTNVFAYDFGVVHNKRFDYVSAREGDQIDVYVDPEGPERSAIRRGVGDGVYTTLIVDALLLTGGVLFVVVPRRYAKKPKLYSPLSSNGIGAP